MAWLNCDEKIIVEVRAQSNYIFKDHIFGHP